MPELKRPLDPSDSTALVVAKRPRNELVEVKDKSKAVVSSVSIKTQPLMGWCFLQIFDILHFTITYGLHTNDNFRDLLVHPIWKLQLC